MEDGKLVLVNEIPDNPARTDNVCNGGCAAEMAELKAKFVELEKQHEEKINLAEAKFAEMQAIIDKQATTIERLKAKQQ